MSFLRPSYWSFSKTHKKAYLNSKSSVSKKVVPCDILTCMESFLSCCDIFLRETWWTVLRFLWTHIGCTQRANWGCGAGPGGVEAPTWRSGSRNKGTESSCHSAVNTRCGQWSIISNLPWFEREIFFVWSIWELRLTNFYAILLASVFTVWRDKLQA